MKFRANYEISDNLAALFAILAPSIVFLMKLPRWSSLAWLDERGKTGTASERWRPSRKLIYSMTVAGGVIFVVLSCWLEATIMKKAPFEVEAVAL